jgi:hypothetical protein
LFFTDEGEDRTESMAWRVILYCPEPKPGAEPFMMRTLMMRCFEYGAFTQEARRFSCFMGERKYFVFAKVEEGEWKLTRS